ncbi:MAG TPA: fused MFS/spermidine synthase [bacterium]|nr:fused MFS/spermidine synthase [bacterium]HQI48827.1 fused MFS/spermidine synthase [bacterium]HQJ64338.1 fused MFS/spermidine synthase [bacterium]HQJ65450.1 fused MFS/spermidine synthase [bacterium]
MARFLLYLVVSVAGAAVLAIELLGTRVLAPFYGSSLYLWAALITVTLLSLSLGYYLGGRWADRGAALERLAALPAGAGLWLMLVPLLKQPVLLRLQPLGLRAAALLAATLLFAPSLTLLGMVTPYALKLKTHQLEQLGRTAGSLSALSTVASVFSALLTGYWLIPAAGINRMTWGIAWLLLITAAAVLLGGRRNLKGAGLVLILGLALTLMASGLQTRPGVGVLTVQQSPFGEIRVVERNGTRFLLIDGAIHTATEARTLATEMPYVAAFDLVRNFYDRTGEMLLIGLGGGSVAKNWSAKEWQVDAVEIDPVVAEMAGRFFGLEGGEARIHLADGRQFLRSSSRTYDVILLDAFGSSSIPFHLTTLEVFQLIRSHLSPEGVLAVNVECVGWQDPLVQSLALTLKRVFETVLALPCAEPPNALGNVLLLAANRALEFPEDWLGNPGDFLDDDYQRWCAVQRNHAWDNRYTPATEQARLLTDDHNPSDLWAERINRAARHRLAELFPAPSLAW